MLGIRLFLVGALLLLAACTSNPATGGNSVSVLLSPEQERQIGAREHPRLVAEMGGAYRDPALQAYVTAIGLKLVRVSETPAAPYTFTIIDSDAVNAFALPGGYVHVTRGLLALADSEAELAGVLAHEIAHIVARHPAQRYNRTLTVGLGAAVLGAVAATAGLPADIADLTLVGAKAHLQSYSREQELEADMLGVGYLSQAGYDPTAMATFLEQLNHYSRWQAVLAGRPETSADGDSIMASHPRTAARIAQVNRLAEQAAAANAAQGREVYLARIDGVIFGDSPEQGLRIGQDFYHQGLRFAVRVPPGFAFVNRPDQIVARGPGGALIAFDRVTTQTLRDAARYVGRDWGAGLGLTQVERIEVNGMAGATGATRVMTRSGPLDIRLVAIQADQRHVYRLIFITPPQMTRRLAAALKQTIASFRRLSEAEAAAIRPLRIRVITVKPGDTTRSLAAALPFVDHQLEWFLVLNRIDPGEPLTPGQRVKIVTRGGH